MVIYPTLGFIGHPDSKHFMSLNSYEKFLIFDFQRLVSPSFSLISFRNSYYMHVRLSHYLSCFLKSFMYFTSFSLGGHILYNIFRCIFQFINSPLSCVYSVYPSIEVFISIIFVFQDAQNFSLNNVFLNLVFNYFFPLCLRFASYGLQILQIWLTNTAFVSSFIGTQPCSLKYSLWMLWCYNC